MDESNGTKPLSVMAHRLSQQRAPSPLCACSAISQQPLSKAQIGSKDGFELFVCSLVQGSCSGRAKVCVCVCMCVYVCVCVQRFGV